jgi:hypothetical protein
MWICSFAFRIYYLSPRPTKSPAPRESVTRPRVSKRHATQANCRSTRNNGKSNAPIEYNEQISYSPNNDKENEQCTTPPICATCRRRYLIWTV